MAATTKGASRATRKGNKKGKTKASTGSSSGSTRRRNRSRGKRLAVVYDIDGPRVRLGLGWFVLALVALAIGSLGVAVLYGVAAVGAAAQSARCWRSRRAGPDVLVAAAFAGIITVVGVVGAELVGLVVIGLPVAAVIVAGDQRGARGRLSDAGFTIQCALFVGLAASSVVLLRDLEVGAAVSLVLLVSAYECGDFLIGTGAPNAIEGPIAGISAVAVVSFAIAALEIAPFELGSGLAFGALAAVLAPLGQLLASALLPRPQSRAPALRRLDSLLLAGPTWYVALDLILL